MVVGHDEEIALAQLASELPRVRRAGQPPVGGHLFADHGEDVVRGAGG
jgi:hypothetical protein